MGKAEFIIAGGGIAGLAAAIALAPRETILLEQANLWQEVGAGLQLGPNAVHALQKLDAWDAVEPVTSSPPAILVRDGMSGRVLKRLPLGKNFEQRFGAPYRVAHRADLHHALRHVATQSRNLHIKLGETVSSFHQDQHCIIATAPSGTWKAQALLAADGVKSTLRQQLFGGSQPRAAGHVIHRALLPSSALEGFDESDSVQLWLYPNGHVVHYPAGASHMLNLVAVTPERATVDETFSRACPTLNDILVKATSWLPWPALFVKPLERFSDGRILLVGDAAHATVPYLAQGAAMALEDGASIKLAIEATSDMQDFALKAGTGRPARARLVHESSMKQAKIYHATGLFRRTAQLAMQCSPNHLFMSRLKQIYGQE